MSLKFIIVATLCVLACEGADSTTASRALRGRYRKHQKKPCNKNKKPDLPKLAQKNIVELAAATPDLSTLVTAVTAGDLAGALSGAGPLTVFAPTNAAFAAVPEAVLDALLDPANKASLQTLLKYHVAAGAAGASGSLEDGQKIKTLEGGELTGGVKEEGGAKTVTVDGAAVVGADVEASNGMVHVIDVVLVPPSLESLVASLTGGMGGNNEDGYSAKGPVMGDSGSTDEEKAAGGADDGTADEDGALPETDGDGDEGSQDPAEGGDEGEQGAPAPAQKNIVELAAATPDLSTLVTAVTAGDLAGALSGAGPLTVFAPTNAAFAAVPEAVLDALLDPANKASLQTLLKYHVAAGAAVASGSLEDGQKIKTLEGGELTVGVKEEGGAKTVTVDGAAVVGADVEASNGMVHVIDVVLVPPSLESLVASLTGGMGGNNEDGYSAKDPVMGDSGSTDEEKAAGGADDGTADEDGALPETDGDGDEGSQDPAEGGDEGEQGAPAPAQKNIVELAAATPDLSTLVTAVTAGDLAGALSGAGPLTVFAPTNAAFAAVPEAVLDALLDPANK